MQTTTGQQPQTGVPVAGVAPQQPQPLVARNAYWNPNHVTPEEKRACCTCTRASACVVAFMFAIGGIAMFSVGIARLVEHGHRYQLIHEYNDAVEEAESKYYHPTAMANDLHTISVTHPAESGTPQYASQTEVDVVAAEAEPTMEDYKSVVYTTSVRDWETSNLFTTFSVTRSSRYYGYYNDTQQYTTESIDRYIPWTQAQSEVVQCNIHACETNCDSGDDDDHDDNDMLCTSSSMQTYCELEFGSDAAFSGDSSCKGGETCGTCKFTGYLEHVCVVMEDDMANGFNHHLRSCFYPFNYDSNIYGAFKGNGTHTVQVDFRSSADPFIALQRITKGTGSFGHPTSHLRAGVLLVIFGLGMMIAPCCAVCCYRCCCKESSRRRHVEEGASPSTAANGNNNGVQMAEAQPVQGYPAAALAVPVPQEQRTENPIVPQQAPRGEVYGYNSDPYANHRVPADGDTTRLFGSRGSITSSNTSTLHCPEEVEVEFEVPTKNH